MWPNLQFSGDLVTFTGEDLENFIFFSSERHPRNDILSFEHLLKLY